MNDRRARKKTHTHTRVDVNFLLKSHNAEDS